MSKNDRDSNDELRRNAENAKTAKTAKKIDSVTDENAETPDANPPRTTSGGWFTAPKFGSAGSGGAELEPGPEDD